MKQKNCEVTGFNAEALRRYRAEKASKYSRKVSERRDRKLLLEHIEEKWEEITQRGKNEQQ